MKEYGSPTVVITKLDCDVVTASTGDTPVVDFDW